MKFTALASLVGLAAVASAGTVPDAYARPALGRMRSVKVRRGDPHRLLRKRLADAAATGPGQGAVHFAALQSAIVGAAPAKRAARPAKVDKRRHHAKKAKAKRDVRPRHAEDDDCDEGDANTDAKSLGAEPAAEDDCDEGGEATAQVAGNQADASGGDGGDDDCEEDEPKPDTANVKTADAGSSGDAGDADKVASTQDSSGSLLSTTSASKLAPADAGQAGTASTTEDHADGNKSHQGSTGGSGSSSTQIQAGSGGGQQQQPQAQQQPQSSGELSGQQSGQQSGGGEQASAPASGGGSQCQGTGQATYFTQNGNAGNCGNVNPDSAMIVAIPTGKYAGGSVCGKTVTIKNLSNGQTATATVADSCPSCPGACDLDLSTGLFAALGGTPDQGVFPISYSM